MDRVITIVHHFSQRGHNYVIYYLHQNADSQTYEHIQQAFKQILLAFVNNLIQFMQAPFKHLFKHYLVTTKNL